ncbi:MAG: MFS transporter [Candidatus Odinarchaeota archaeon]
MNNRILSSLLASKDLPREAQGVINRYFAFSGLMRGLFMFSSTFYVLFIVEIVGFKELGVLLAVSFILQAVIDYPSGALGDRIGQRKILAIAYSLHAFAFSCLILAKSLEFIFVIYIVEAMARSFESGAIQSWLDNNYKSIATDTDPEYKTYLNIQSRIEMFIGLFSSSMFLLGGIVATWLFRETVFLLQALGMIIIGILIIYQLKDVTDIENASHERYVDILKGSLGLVIKSPRLSAIVGGVVITNTSIVIWVELMLMPVYFGYTGSDALAGSLRFTVWVTSAIVMGLAGFWIKTLKAKKWLSRIHFIHPFVFFGFFASITFFFPLQNSLNVFAVALLVIEFTFIGILHLASQSLRQSLFIEMIPNNRRNSFYSLLPTLNYILVAPLIFITGFIMETFGLSTGIAFLGVIELFGALIYFISFKLPETWRFSRSTAIIDELSSSNVLISSSHGINLAEQMKCC